MEPARLAFGSRRRSYFFFSSRRRHTRCSRDWSSDVCSSDLIAHRHLTMSVNLSAKQFLQPNLVEDIKKLLRELALPPEALKLEITESTVMEIGRAHV